MASKKFYVVWQGRTPGIYDSWQACSEQVQGAPGACFKSFRTEAEAQDHMDEAVKLLLKNKQEEQNNE